MTITHICLATVYTPQAIMVLELAAGMTLYGCLRKQTTSTMNNIIMSTRVYVQHTSAIARSKLRARFYRCVRMHANGRGQVANCSRVTCSNSAHTSINCRGLHTDCTRESFTFLLIYTVPMTLTMDPSAHMHLSSFMHVFQVCL
jgi:hypothetical protein